MSSGHEALIKCAQIVVVLICFLVKSSLEECVIGVIKSINVKKY